MVQAIMTGWRARLRWRLAIPDFANRIGPTDAWMEDCFGETPKPTRETRALPRQDPSRSQFVTLKPRPAPGLAMFLFSSRLRKQARHLNHRAVKDVEDELGRDT